MILWQLYLPSIQFPKGIIQTGRIQLRSHLEEDITLSHPQPHGGEGEGEAVA